MQRLERGRRRQRQLGGGGVSCGLSSSRSVAAVQRQKITCARQVERATVAQGRAGVSYVCEICIGYADSVHRRARCSDLHCLMPMRAREKYTKGRAKMVRRAHLILRLLVWAGHGHTKDGSCSPQHGARYLIRPRQGTATGGRKSRFAQALIPTPWPFRSN